MDDWVKNKFCYRLRGLGFTLAVAITILYNHRLSAPLLSIMQQHMLAVNRDLLIVLAVTVLLSAKM